MVTDPGGRGTLQTLGVEYTHRKGFRGILRGSRGAHGQTWFFLYHTGGCRREDVQLLGMTLLQVAGKVVTSAEALSTARAQEVPSACVHHSVTPHILPSEEAPAAALTLVLSLPHGYAWWRSAGMSAQVLEESRHASKNLTAHLAGKISGHRRGVGSHVASQTQPSVVVFATLFTLQVLLVGVMSL